MIFCHDKIYGKVWKVTKFDKYLDLQMSTSEKAQDGTYINSSWFPRVIGHAFNTLKDKLHDGDRICITKSKLSNEKYTAKDGTTKSSFRFVILEADLADTVSTAPEIKPSEEGRPAPAETYEECPW